MSQPGAIMDYYSLMWVTLQRARTAREAIQVMDNLTQTYGYVKCAACMQTCMCTVPPSWGPTRGLARVSPVCCVVSLPKLHACNLPLIALPLLSLLYTTFATASPPHILHA